ncbi:peptide chain release factor 1 [candidate division WWE3 bacterium CG06_land_8_20_14_3_00_42_16]|uniref:Peptide chain release factor 1 n=3 Tax=Katanobacteria TaxID=422282 RepID=A0A2M7AMB6_UNCKA|nr:MAG: peptide chain release factor 1 [candidate division WWE3 bacterium CG06_land_8_20_14_3_00_42_16]PIZ43795.1 MAG: peptide chain release factor 1 [candidate division WWE3 bacterium CG_4_10_14_0_2_um_filter_42_8]PJA37744.1 MAG: peptide chain release factor 1 [candidate division WWE3 bacterium CG_4_9_14_3_um_filter_43_9]
MYHQDFLNQQLKNLEAEIANNEKLLNDPELRDLARLEIEELKKQKEKMYVNLNHKNTDSPLDSPTRKVILEIRAAAGGEEAGLFAADLLRMYQKYAENRKWKFQQVSKTSGGIGNIKEVIATISGQKAYERLQFESGVHRVQRIPQTESAGRIHTSTATVAILPFIEERDFEIKREDLKVDFYRAGGHGGQNVNKVETAVRITHLPSGIIATCQDERTQIQNRLRAMDVLRSRLFQLQKKNKQEKLNAKRFSQVGAGERSEKIRTYNFPQNRVTDHRFGKSWHQLETILDGDLDEILEALKTLKDKAKD